MRVNNYLYRKMLVFIFSLSFIILVSISASFAFSNNNYGIINNSENLQVEFVDNMSSGAGPYSMEEGVEKAPLSKVKIKNTQNKDISFSLLASEMSSGSSLLTSDKLYYSINRNRAKRLGRGDTVIYKGVVKANGELTISLGVWVGSDLIDNDDQGKQINIGFNIIEN